MMGGYVPFLLILYPLHFANLIYEGVVAHVHGPEIFFGMVRDPVMELIMTRYDEASLVTF